jgi:hypothetical protein
MSNQTFQIDENVQTFMTKAVKKLRRSMIIIPICLILITALRVVSYKSAISLNHLSTPAYFGFAYVILIILFSVFFIPIRKIRRIEHTIYAIQKSENETFEFYLFNTSSKSPNSIICKKEDFTIEEEVLKSKQLNIHTMNIIFVDGKKYEIFNKILHDAHLIN